MLVRAYRLFHHIFVSRRSWSHSFSGVRIPAGCLGNLAFGMFFYLCLIHPPIRKDASTRCIFPGTYFRKNDCILY